MNRICPKCGGDIEFDDIYDVSDHNDFCVGHCLNCNTEYQWTEYYEYVGISEIKEIK